MSTLHNFAITLITRTTIKSKTAFALVRTTDTKSSAKIKGRENMGMT
ncbi:uncharacterized protein RSE6_03544 [Rhynchosporium secalis]|uniref:Uncharacterized protein n=1 Tax=Rhynchosporium secalis TaxID=38038 RepID=A0A1E1M331_RHYSE|nr:uncharacterized protein RSE6_03544 [Rhynchosporium secalis]